MCLLKPESRWGVSALAFFSERGRTFPDHDYYFCSQMRAIPALPAGSFFPAVSVYCRGLKESVPYKHHLVIENEPTHEDPGWGWLGVLRVR